MAEACLICRGATVYERGVHPKQGRMAMIGCHACGTYFFTFPDAREVIAALPDDRRFVLSALSRRASDAGAPLELMAADVNEVIDAAPRLTLGDRIDRLLLLLAERAPDYLVPVA